MVKGVSRRVIVVKTPDRRLFEQAIFIVKEDAFTQNGVTAEQVLAEAQRVADGYVRHNSVIGKRMYRIPAFVYAAAGALLSTIIWVIVMFL
ncbi:MAG: translation initiation factor 2 [Oscillospiraceae bacterium]|nr:translation initiation factor 2 [Oscillospiraceae bacterium]